MGEKDGGEGWADLVDEEVAVDLAALVGLGCQSLAKALGLALRNALGIGKGPAPDPIGLAHLEGGEGGERRREHGMREKRVREKERAPHDYSTRKNEQKNTTRLHRGEKGNKHHTTTTALLTSSHVLQHCSGRVWAP